MAETGAAFFDVYGYEFVVRSTATGAVQGLSSDFAFFRAPHVANPVSIEILDEQPSYGSLPALEATVYTPRNTSYRDGSLTYIDYAGKGLAVYNQATGDFRISTRDRNLQYEAPYLFLLSQIAEFLDEKGIHRIHALGASIQGRAVLVLLPMGGGKSTLGAHLLRHAEVKLLSDDSPFVNRSCRLLAFPLHLGLLPGSESEIPLEHQRKVERMEFGPKILVEYDYYAERVAATAEPGFVFLGRRSLSTGCSVEPAGTLSSLRAMLINCVVGLGLFQGMEFVFTRSPWEVASKARVASSRLRSSLRLLRRSQVCHLTLGRDHAENARTVVEYVRKGLGG